MRWFFRSLFLLTIAGSAVLMLVGGLIFWNFSKNLPEIISVNDYRPLAVTRIVTTNGDKPGVTIGEFSKERRYVVPYEKIPQVVIQAFISAEDDQFFTHQGVNFSSIIRASIANFRAGHVVQGGSTITQQVAKSLLLTSEKSFVRKIKELILASRMERNLGKQQILYLYLNQIYLGHGSYGVQATAMNYFRKDISKISIAEAAMMAGMPQAPGKYSPHLNPKRAKERQLYVLRRMFENKFITQAQMTDAAAEGLKIYHDEDVNKKYSAYYIEHLRRYLVEKYGDKAVYEDGLTVTVPTSPDLFKVASKSLQDGLRSMDKNMGYRGPVKHFKAISEIEEFLKDERMDLIAAKTNYEVLMPDGRLDPLESLKKEGITSDAQLLKVDEIYQGVVTSIDDRKKSVGVIIGTTRAELPLEKMKWAKRPEPLAPSLILSQGDLIWVKILRNEGQVLVSLEQEPQVQGALFSMDVATGNVLAMEGGYDFEKSEFNRATQALRQPGSSFKPIIFSAAIEKGYTPASVIVDSPIVYEDADNGKWKPGNFEEKFYGDTLFRNALIKSRNIPTIKIVQSIQVPYLINFAKRLGMTTQFPNDLSISLGSGTVSLAEMTKIYAIYPRQGRKVEPVYLSQVKDREGKVLEEAKLQPLGDMSAILAQINAAPPASPSPTPGASIYPLANDPLQVMDPRVAYIASHLMTEVVSFGTGHDAKSLNRPAAGKTGTTNDYLDAWFMGFTPQVVTGVWVGFDNQKSLGSGETGARVALPIWLGFMKEAVKNYPVADFAVPSGVVFESIHPVSGKLAAPNSSNSVREAFIEGTQPTPEALSGSSGSTSKSQSEFFKEDIE